MILNKRYIQLLAIAQTGKKLESWAMDTFVSDLNSDTVRNIFKYLN